MKIVAASLSLLDQVGDADRREIETRMRDDVLETKSFPEITYKAERLADERISAGRYRVRVGGRLSLHGAARPHQLDLDLTVFDDALQIRGDCVLRLSDFQIKPVSRAGRRDQAEGRVADRLRSVRSQGDDMTPPRILVAGIGNIFLGDDAFGVEVIRRLLERRPPAEAHVVDFGIRGLDLAYALLDDYEAVVLVDATPRGEAPGTIYVLEIDAAEAAAPEGQGVAIQAHSLDPVQVLRLAGTMGAAFGRLLLVGCEPSPFEGEDDMRDGLSPAVAAAVDEAVVAVESLIERLLRGEGVELIENRVRTEEEVER